MKRAAIALAFVALFIPDARTSVAPDTSWLQWGGPRRNFMVESPPLAASWPSGGPKRLWTRSLGEGHSAVVVDGNRIYTMYRAGGLLSMVRRTQSETIGAFDAATGKTVWEHTYDSPTGDLNLSEGAGPHSTPLIVGNTLFAIGSRMEFFALDKNSGKVLWQHDVMKAFGSSGGVAAGAAQGLHRERQRRVRHPPHGRGLRAADRRGAR